MRKNIIGYPYRSSVAIACSMIAVILLGVLLQSCASSTAADSGESEHDNASTSQVTGGASFDVATLADRDTTVDSTSIGGDSNAPTNLKTTAVDLPQAPLPRIPAVDREFRGVWVTTVNNGDWPSRQDLTTAEQQQELIDILDRVKELGLNAVIFQVRPTADAMYASSLEPWSVYLTGKQGQAPDPFWDPLRFVTRAAHDRGLELHAWFNPFRASFINNISEYDEIHVTQSDMVVSYGQYMWMDPGNPDAVAHSMNIILDVLNRYDVDGIHLDDYFYPYPVVGKNGQPVSFPDRASWIRSGGPDSGLGRADWRRQNVNHFVQNLSIAIRDMKPWVKFGISPFGIWQPGYPDGIQGLNPYEVLYADSRKWLTSGWVDYLTPQLYWAMDPPAQSYSALLSWWAEQNVYGRHLWPGNFSSRITLTGPQYWGREELYRQIAHTQGYEGADGNVLFRMQSLMPADHALGDGLKESIYTAPAITPESTWMRADSIPVPKITVSQMGTISATVNGARPEAVKYWLVRYLIDGEWVDVIKPGFRNTIVLASSADTGMLVAGRQKENAHAEQKTVAICVSAVDRIGREGIVVCHRQDPS